MAHGLLRDELRFEGVAITDDLGSGAVKATHRVPEAAVAALRAGSDLVQIASVEDQARVREAILAAVESGELPPGTARRGRRARPRAEARARLVPISRLNNGGARLRPSDSASQRDHRHTQTYRADISSR